MSSQNMKRISQYAYNNPELLDPLNSVAFSPRANHTDRAAAAALDPLLNMKYQHKHVQHISLSYAHGEFYFF